MAPAETCGFLHFFPLEKGSVNDNINTLLNETPWKPFLTIVLKDRTNSHLEVNIVISVLGGCDLSGRNWLQKMEILQSFPPNTEFALVKLK